MDGSTALVVAHRLATIARLDRILVLERGWVVEEGTHAELLAVGRQPASTAGCGSTSRVGSWPRDATWHGRRRRRARAVMGVDSRDAAADRLGAAAAVAHPSCNEGSARDCRADPAGRGIRRSRRPRAWSCGRTRSSRAIRPEPSPNGHGRVPAAGHLCHHHRKQAAPAPGPARGATCHRRRSASWPLGRSAGIRPQHEEQVGPDVGLGHGRLGRAHPVRRRGRGRSRRSWPEPQLVQLAELHPSLWRRHPEATVSPPLLQLVRVKQ